MAYIDRYDTAIGLFFDRKLRGVHTNIRGKITEVDYGAGTVSVQPTAFTEYESGTVDRYPAIHDVPLQMPTGNNGKAFLSMPVKAGDSVGLAFSERNEDDNTDTGTHEMSPGWAATHGKGKEIDPENVILQNDKASQTLKPGGDILFENELVKVELLPSGDVKISNGPGNFEMQKSGDVLVNGAKITKDGKMITAQGIDIDVFWKVFSDHVHGGVQNGDGKTKKYNE